MISVRLEKSGYKIDGTFDFSMSDVYESLPTPDGRRISGDMKIANCISFDVPIELPQHPSLTTKNMDRFYELLAEKLKVDFLNFLEQNEEKSV